MTKDEALKLALEALTHFEKAGLATLKTVDAITAIREALAEQPAQQQEPVEVKQIAEALRQVGLTLIRSNGGFRVMDLGRIEAQTTSPPASKPWVGLTDEELELIASECRLYPRDFARAIEAKLREKNT